ncbi:hypothetical protein CORC01_04618 [Colletotrichum orchidophilum]|uniref:Uncharacterized protein n=1 Tax=Colletotrichum orchidophilum TaxID=1209926 RepID=A0A1G4BEY8_9PEZI|nr:uncharacterized protein CORC01_04618 [Colletotrichum orchidophilum]OHE99971.1 hypothetical protein CORC01_04618 [Colletotrichum orchidophilum]
MGIVSLLLAGKVQCNCLLNLTSVLTSSNVICPPTSVFLICTLLYTWRCLSYVSKDDDEQSKLSGKQLSLSFEHVTLHVRSRKHPGQFVPYSEGNAATSPVASAADRRLPDVAALFNVSMKSNKRRMSTYTVARGTRTITTAL